MRCSARTCMIIAGSAVAMALGAVIVRKRSNADRSDAGSDGSVHGSTSQPDEAAEPTEDLGGDSAGQPADDRQETLAD